MPLCEAQEYPDLLAIVERKVKPSRQAAAKEVAEQPWWLFFRQRRELYDAIRSFNRVLVASRHQPHWLVSEVPNGPILSESLVVFALPASSAFSLLQSRPHEIWARFFGSSMKDDLRYTPSDCFETFPFPRDWESNPALEEAGRTYYEFRADLMIRNNEGLTKTYNRFHALEEQAPTSSASASSTPPWTAPSSTPTAGRTSTACDFFLEYEDEDDDDDTAKARKKKKPWRYRWPDEVRDDVLARLLALNAERAEEERLAGEAAEAKAKPAARKRAPRKGRASDDDRPLLK